MVRASRDGSYTNQAHLDGYSLDGRGLVSADVSASIVVGGLGHPAQSMRYGGDWQPPFEDFGLNGTDEGFGAAEDI